MQQSNGAPESRDDFENQVIEQLNRIERSQRSAALLPVALFVASLGASLIVYAAVNIENLPIFIPAVVAALILFAIAMNILKKYEKEQ